MSTTQLHFTLTFTGRVDLNGLSPEEGTRLLQANLDAIAPRITGEGLITGFTELTVDDFSEAVVVTELP